MRIGERRVDKDEDLVNLWENMGFLTSVQTKDEKIYLVVWFVCPILQ